MTSPVPEIDHLREEVRRGDVTLFVGAGLSAGAGLPLWADLLRPLAADVGIRLPSSRYLTATHLLDAAGAYENRFGRQALISQLRKTLGLVSAAPTAAHAAIAEVWPKGVVITTNFDSLLEASYRDAGRNAHTIVDDGDLPY